MPVFLIGILGGTLLASALQAIFGIGSTMAQNKYNSPEAMKRRVAKAGLPLAYMYQGKVATQQQAPQLSIDPHLGTLAEKQGSKLAADTLGKGIENKVAQGELDWLQKLSSLRPGGKVQTNQEHLLGIDRATKYAQKFITQYDQKLKKIELQVEQDAFGEGIQLNQKREALNKASQQVQNLLEQAGLMDQLKKIRGFEEKMNESLTENLDSMPDWISALLKIILIATKR